MTTEGKTKPVSDLFEQALKSYEQALKTGLKLQEESAKVFLGCFTPAPGADTQKKFKAISEEAIPQVEKAVEETLKLMEQNSRTGVALLKKAVAATQATSAQEAQAKSLALYEGCLEAVRENAAALTQASNKAAESWLGYIRRSTEPVPGRKA
jgi:DNA gyrase/topoisomerase IV subunit B